VAPDRHLRRELGLLGELVDEGLLGAVLVVVVVLDLEPVPDLLPRRLLDARRLLDLLDGLLLLGRRLVARRLLA
jgi:hypothetical protein